MELREREADVDDVVILDLAGRLDIFTMPPLQDWIANTLARPRCKIVVNMDAVAFLDSTGLATLVQGMKLCQKMGGDLYLCCLRQPVRMIFEMTRLDKAFAIFAAEADAVAALAGLDSAPAG